MAKITRKAALTVGLAVTSVLGLAGCDDGGTIDPNIVTNGDLSAAVCRNCFSGEGVFEHGRFVIVGDGCLGLEEVPFPDAPEGTEPRTVVAALPPGSDIADDDTIRITGVGPIALGEVFNYEVCNSASPWGTQDEPIMDMTIPSGCPDDLDVLVVIPLYFSLPD